MIISFKIISLFVFLSFLQQEPLKTIDATSFNKEISNRTDIKTPDELIRLYHIENENSEGTRKFSIETEVIEENYYKITLIHEGVPDDSVSAVKIIMKAKRNGCKWTVTEIKKTWKCWKERGHADWGIEPCR
ncbi:MAG: hypothetical protein LBQ22_03895 [Bacteroidales bacterium]|jgi:hypothetical protein|nr:hypothetical protein [Bacteroidales bacterium]